MSDVRFQRSRTLLIRSFGVALAFFGATSAHSQSPKSPPRLDSLADLCGLSWLAVPYAGAAGGAVGLVTGGAIGLTRHETYWVGVRLPVSAR
jgi:hypothetical protein